MTGTRPGDPTGRSVQRRNATALPSASPDRRAPTAFAELRKVKPAPPVTTSANHRGSQVALTAHTAPERPGVDFRAVLRT
jgi:hypothetical protein